MVVSIRHPQRVLDALPSVKQVPKADNSAIHVISARVQSPTSLPYPISPYSALFFIRLGYLDTDCSSGIRSPLPPSYKIHDIATKSILHVLFLPMSFKNNAYQGTDPPEEVLKAGALYHECGIVSLRMPSLAMTDAADAQATNLVYMTESTTYRTNKFHELIELWRANSTELATISYNMTNCKRATTVLVPSLPR
ncbi:hypothetical protein DFJ58DRAFT_731341 [Suillus subalutaceus]|uniref:uncharacterized protein n=1 Tax=Suillus subalutaceus TaxID=48586 RepID=UPI001B865CE3|nr:uncharacterized protein DFJ58DRAFT_731341 [Suillus subalutaceus]KAG1844037.1 hypothetical protein DFJ58DRAFT_731341 [Suillus subalutaceus]